MDVGVSCEVDWGGCECEWDVVDPSSPVWLWDGKGSFDLEEHISVCGFGRNRNVDFPP